jgi:hypothetical protein
MAYTEHKIIVGDQDIDILIKEIDERGHEYSVESDSEAFAQIFGTDSFTLIKGDSSSENAVMGNVVQRHQSKALEILEEIKILLA